MLGHGVDGCGDPGPALVEVDATPRLVLLTGVGDRGGRLVVINPRGTGDRAAVHRVHMVPGRADTPPLATGQVPQPIRVECLRCSLDAAGVRIPPRGARLQAIPHQSLDPSDDSSQSEDLSPRGRAVTLPHTLPPRITPGGAVHLLGWSHRQKGGTRMADDRSAPTAEEMVLYDVSDRVAVVTLNNPSARNGWNPTMERQYFEQLDRADADQDVRVIVVTGTDGYFCPGLDMKALQQTAGAHAGLVREGRRPMHYPLRIRKPMIAAINGACAGMGLLHSLFCDVRFAARGARFSTAYVRRGLPAEYGSSWLLPRLIRLDHALDLLLSGRVFDADEAASMGLVTRVCEPDDLIPAVHEYAQMLASQSSPRAMMAIRRQIYTDLSQDFETALTRSLHVMHQFNTTENPDFGEGVASFVERREPRFEPLPPDFQLAGDWHLPGGSFPPDAQG